MDALFVREGPSRPVQDALWLRTALFGSASPPRGTDARERSTDAGSPGRGASRRRPLRQAAVLLGRSLQRDGGKQQRQRRQPVSLGVPRLVRPAPSEAPRPGPLAVRGGGRLPFSRREPRATFRVRIQLEAGSRTPDVIFAGRREAWGLDAQIRTGLLEIWAEYLRAVYRSDDRIPSARLSTDGWYLQASYVLLQRWQAVARHDRFDPNVDARGDDTRTWTAGLNYLVRGHDLKLQVNYLRTMLPGSAPAQDKLIARLQAVF
ncbi:MAG: porin [Acidobacteriota bacterium]